MARGQERKWFPPCYPMPGHHSDESQNSRELDRLSAYRGQNMFANVLHLV